MKTPEPRLWVRLAFACNNRCVFCLDGDQNDPGKAVSMKDILGRLRKGRSQGLTRVVLSGGEPTLHPRFIELVRKAKAMGYTHAQVITNGRRFCYPGFLDQCVEAGLREVTFSMHGHTRQLHDKLVGVPGAFVQAIAGLSAALKKPRLIVSVDVVVNRLNVKELEKLLRFYIRLGVREFDLLHPVPFGRAWDNWKKLNYDPDRTTGLRRALALSRQGIRIWTNRLPARYLEGFEDLIQAPEKLHDEVRGREAMFKAFVRKGKAFECRGERCRHCFMQGFCADLLLLRKERRLASKPMPECLPIAGSREAFAWNGKRTDLWKWTDFYIRRRYHVHGSACLRCPRKKRCEGAPIQVVRSRGFSVLAPGR
ncbi:MAG: radical SAM protein [Elusimicrobiota bacterium]